MLNAAGFTGRVLDKTPPGAPGAQRGEEVAAWLAGHAVGGYVIIDDQADMGELVSHLILTHPPKGGQNPPGSPHLLGSWLLPPGVPT
jgi:hypothetical protein